MALLRSFFPTFVRQLSTAQVGLTSEVYDVKRGQYSNLNDSHLAFFEKTLGETRVLTKTSDLEGSNTDWLRIFRGRSKCMLKPRSVDEISAVLRFCYENNLAVCTQGGNTGFCGGAVPVFDEIILSIQSLNKIMEFDSLAGEKTSNSKHNANI